MTFYREIFGLHRAIRRSYRTLNQRMAFEETETYRVVQEMLKDLRERRPPKPEGENAAKKEDDAAEKTEKEAPEPLRVITVRIPRSLHDALRVEAQEYHTTMNKLCISKLLQFIDASIVPEEPPGLPRLISDE